jgi:ABC-type uncharacterized transport system ATPase subunit
MTLPESSGIAGPDKTTATAGEVPAVAVSQLTKRFPGVVANDQVTFEAAKGEVHALLGENGAGKTTLCNMLIGLYRPDEGEIRVDGARARIRSPRDAQDLGIAMVHQQMRLVHSMTVAENVVLGWSEQGGWRYSPARTEHEVAQVAERFKMSVDPSARVWQLSVGEQQRVEILKALYRGAHILILDEPTSVLTPQEAEQLFASVREMASSGSTIIFISHKLPEVMAVSDRITILRRGSAIATLDTADTSASELARLMVGRDVLVGERRAGGQVSTEKTAMLELEGVCATGDLGTQALTDVDLTVFAGEILGVAGVSGNGQRELAEVVAGLRPSTHGKVRICGQDLARADPQRAIDLGLAYIPEDRLGTGVSPSLSLVDNFLLKSYRSAANRRGPFLKLKAATAEADELMKRFDVRAPGSATPVGQLSGGNVQKVLLARELSSHPRVLVAAQPTRGLDVGATEYVRNVLVDAAKTGVAILLISEDLEEIFQLSDRVAVFYGGRVVGIVDPERVDEERLGLMMAGMSDGDSKRDAS